MNLVERICLYVRYSLVHIFRVVAPDRGMNLLLVLMRVCLNNVSNEIKFVFMATLLSITGMFMVQYSLQRQRWSLIKSNNHIGGYKMHSISYETIRPYLSDTVQHHLAGSGSTFIYIDHTKDLINQYVDSMYVQSDSIPPHLLVKMIPVSAGREIAALHGLVVGSRATSAMLHNQFLLHSCAECPRFVTIFAVTKPETKQEPCSNMNGISSKFKLNVMENDKK
jgi:hypothetical protein